MKKFIFLMALASLTSCTSMSKSAEYADPVPNSRLYGSLDRSDAQLVVMLDSELDASCTIRLSIDGKPAADFSNGEIAHFGLTFGVHRLLAEPLAHCAKYGVSEEVINVKSGDALHRRLTGTGLKTIPYD